MANVRRPALDGSTQFSDYRQDVGSIAERTCLAGATIIEWFRTTAAAEFQQRSGASLKHQGREFMKRQRLFAVMGTVIVLSSGLLLMTGTLSAQSGRDRTTAIDLSAVTQNWDKVLPAEDRFVILSAFNNRAVRDNETGLVWERTPDEMVRPWSQAISICAERPVGGRFGWRLPSVHELMTLLDPTTGNPALPAGHPFRNVQPSVYGRRPRVLRTPHVRITSAFFKPT